MKIKAGVYPFSHHNVFIPEHLKIMIEEEVKRTGYKNVNSWLNARYKGDWSVQAIKQVLNGRTGSPSVDLLEDVRRMCTKTQLAAKYSFPQLPLIRTSEIRRIVDQDKGLSYKYISEKLGINQVTLSNNINDKVQYRYETAWSLTHFFIEYFKNPWENRQPVVTWDFYGWVRERNAKESSMTREEQSKWRDEYSRRTGGKPYDRYIKKG
tara:strand:- start:332 stop:958 length:627 start_codon:yes stop_codon:yes gene_type:complete